MTSGSRTVSISAAQLAEELGGALEERFLCARSVRLREPLCVKQVVLDELSIEGMKGIGPLVIKNCRIGTLRLRDVQLREGISIEDCELGRLEVRNGSGTSFVIARSSLDRVLMHRCDCVSFDEAVVSGQAHFSETQSRLELSQFSASSVRVLGGGPANLDLCKVQGATVRDRVDVTDLQAVKLEIKSAAIGRINFRHVNVDSWRLLDVVVTAECSLREIAGLRAGAAEGFVEGGFQSVVVAGNPAGTASSIEFRNALIGRDLEVRGAVKAMVGSGTSVQGTLSVQPGIEGRMPTMSVDHRATVRAVEPPPGRIGSEDRAREVAAELLGGDDVRLLAILRGSLTDRPDEEDYVYRALRRAETSGAKGTRRISLWLRGQLFGWGVAVVPPIRVLLIGILLTSVTVFARNPSRSDGSQRFEEALSGALGLWFNVGTGMPSGMAGPAWGLTAVICALAGVALVTVAMGIAIRRLTR